MTYTADPRIDASFAALATKDQSTSSSTTARTVAMRQGDSINARALTAMFKHIIADNRAGGWRKVKREAQAQHSPGVLNT